MLAVLLASPGSGAECCAAAGLQAALQSAQRLEAARDKRVPNPLGLQVIPGGGSGRGQGAECVPGEGVNSRRLRVLISWVGPCADW